MIVTSEWSLPIPFVVRERVLRIQFSRPIWKEGGVWSSTTTVSEGGFLLATYLVRFHAGTSHWCRASGEVPIMVEDEVEKRITVEGYARAVTLLHARCHPHSQVS